MVRHSPGAKLSSLVMGFASSTSSPSRSQKLGWFSRPRKTLSTKGGLSPVGRRGERSSRGSRRQVADLAVEERERAVEREEMWRGRLEEREEEIRNIERQLKDADAD